jgi:hypothetical protein
MAYAGKLPFLDRSILWKLFCLRLEKTLSMLRMPGDPNGFSPHICRDSFQFLIFNPFGKTKNRFRAANR